MAMSITPPFGTNDRNWYACGVDYSRAEYTIKWSGSWQPPSLIGFPGIKGLNIERVRHSAEKQHWWQKSMLLDYGSYALVRICDEPNEFPVIKLAHDRDAQCLFIRNEFNILKSLQSQPVVKVYGTPLSDANGIFGFQMQNAPKNRNH